ncbi:MAG: 16S rRNA (cytidine(1402)-2'-O)-methyltransferase [Candidatus Pacebacteria bacterium]|nr:16S rRNA (cytidine(1402)-2'-O)-methyltransferase [Candidatus Paceibacterota bacterium]MDD5356528.1 16S rRNA (cytidine(1402)-2'-O)-methyltransferase [Candidatus Paceibacterota bacterium]
MSTLYVVGTPIGNLGDITLRALEVFKSVDYVLCEDTRVTAKLLHKYEISRPTISYHSHSDLSKVDHIISLLKDGKNLALVSDAGTPGISDPGSLLVSQVSGALGDEVKIVAIPGPSALVSALSISGAPSSDFLFLGFLPHKKGRETLFREIADSKRTVAFYESPHRIEKALASLQKHFTENKMEGRKIAVARELTKVFEECVSGTASELIAHFQNHQDTVRGEFVVVVFPK